MSAEAHGDAADGKLPRQAPDRWAMFAWCSYDWANSAFPTVILTFVFNTYFVKAVAADPIAGTAAWSYAISISMATVALAGPILGAVADAGGRRKPWVFLFSLVAVVATGLLWLVRPQPDFVVFALVLVAIANFGFETAFIFYNAMLPRIAPPEMVGRISGWGWGLGYAGGLLCLVLALIVLVRPDPPLFGLDRESAEPVRAVALLVAIWFAVFSAAFFLRVPDSGNGGLPIAPAVASGLRALIRTVRDLRRYRQIAIYLFSHMLYTDALNTVFTVGGLYAAVSFGMALSEVIVFGIALNVMAGAGAFAFGWVDDRIGPKRTILIALAAITCFGAALIVVESRFWFWALALPMGLFFGPAQAASRSLMARLAPKHLEAEMFGLYALAGRATAFAGPALFGWVTQATGSQRAGLATILVLFLAGILTLLPVRDPVRSVIRTP